MNKLKIIILFISILLLSGCTATYELTINNNTIKENLTLIETNIDLFDVKNDSGWTIRESVDAALHDEDEFSKGLYVVKSLNKDNQIGINYSSTKLDSVRNSSVLNQCYKNPIVTNSNGIISVDSGSDFECYDFYSNLNTIKVVLKTNHKVSSTNSDQQIGNSYIWNITEEGNKQIQFSYFETATQVNMIVYILAGFIALTIVLGIVFYLKHKAKKANSI